MPRGRKPTGSQALTGAERQARYRARQAGAGAAPAGHRRQSNPGAKPTRPRTRPQRWRAAVDELVALQAEYAAWLDALPEATRHGPTGMALEAIAELDLDEIAAVEPPRGFGRD